jgi:hypothetical protein
MVFCFVSVPEELIAPHSKLRSMLFAPFPEELLGAVRIRGDGVLARLPIGCDKSTQQQMYQSVALARCTSSI